MSNIIKADVINDPLGASSLYDLPPSEEASPRPTVSNRAQISQVFEQCVHSKTPNTRTLSALQNSPGQSTLRQSTFAMSVIFSQATKIEDPLRLDIDEGPEEAPPEKVEFSASAEAMERLKKSHIFDKRVCLHDPLGVIAEESVRKARESAFDETRSRKSMLRAEPTTDDDIIAKAPAIPIVDEERSEGDKLYDIKLFLEPPKKRSNESFDTGMVHVIGVANIVVLPMNWLSYVQLLYRAIKKGDREGVIEYGIKVFTVPFGIAEAFQNGFSLAYAALSGLTISLFVLLGIIFGSIFLTIELSLEIARLVRTLQFRNKLHSPEALRIANTLTLSDTAQLTDEQMEKEIQSIHNSLDKLKIDLQHFMSKKDIEERCDHIHELLINAVTSPSEKHAELKAATEELQLLVLTSALSYINQNYLYLSQEEIDSCDTRAIQDAEFLRRPMTVTEEASDSSSVDISESNNNFIEEDLEADLEFLRKQQELFNKAKETLLNAKRSALGRRVRTKMVNELESTLPNLFDSFRTYVNEPLDKKERLSARTSMISTSIDLLKKLDMQSKKTIHVHIIGIIGILIGIGTFAATALGCPPIAVFAAVAVGFSVLLYRSTAPKAYLDSDDGKWNWSAALPKFLQPRKLEEGEFRSEHELQPLIFDREQERHIGYRATPLLF